MSWSLVWLLCLAGLNHLNPTMAANHHWRGPHQNGHFPDGDFSGFLDDEHLLWKEPLPGPGTSTPLVVEDLILITYAKEGTNTVAAFSIDGDLEWTAQCGTETPGRHRNGSGSNPSVTSDGKHFFAYFKSGDWVGLDAQGKTLWKRNLVQEYGEVSLYWDTGTSPLSTTTGVVITRMHEGSSWLASFHPLTGELQWKVPRDYNTPVEGDHGYSSPILTSLDGQEVILVWGGQHLTCHDPANGEVIWECGGFNPDEKPYWPAVASPMQIQNKVIVAFGRADKRQPRLHGISLRGMGDVTATQHLWENQIHSSFVPSPTTHGSLAILLSDRGTLAGIDPTTGESIWTFELPEHRSSYYASPSAGQDKLIAAREDGAVFVVNLAPEVSLFSESHLGERVIASPVFHGERLILRGEKHLMSFR